MVKYNKVYDSAWKKIIYIDVLMIHDRILHEKNSMLPAGGQLGPHILI